MKTEPLIYIIDNDQSMLDSLSWVVESINLKVKTFTCTQKFMENFDPEQHCCALLNVRMPGCSGPELLRKFKNDGKFLSVIFISSNSDVLLAVSAIKEGAIDFLTKPFNDNILLESINKALSVDEEYRQKRSKLLKIRNRFSSLSDRELQVLQRVVVGKINKLISEELNISLKTVESHRASMMRKMDVTSLAELVNIMHKVNTEA
jgi:FixJ family two-component response regulator